VSEKFFTVTFIIIKKINGNLNRDFITSHMKTDSSLKNP